jgi:cell division protein FtsB
MSLISKEYIIETIDLEIEALMSERDLIQAKINKIEQENENIQARINVLTRLIKEMEDGS